MLDDLSLVLSGPVAHPDPTEVLRALRRRRRRIDDVGMMISDVCSDVFPSDAVNLPGVSSTNTVSA